MPPGSGEEASAGRKAVSEVLGDRYEITGKLGAGAFGEVYEATDTSLHRRVAIKRIRLDAFAEGPELEEVKERFLREARVAAQLRHPNVVTIHDIAAKGASSFMVMELVEGRTLQSLLRERGRLRLAETLAILSPAAAALDYAHQNGVVHRDVKPANLMIEPAGQVKVMDFGIAKAQSSGDITRTGTILGTPNYMSPEQARGAAVDGRADLFSLGCILYECLTGAKPFVGQSVTAILLKILNDPPPAIDFGALGLPVPVGDVLRRALAKGPAERYPTGKQLMDAARHAGEAMAPTVVAPAPNAPATVVSAAPRPAGPSLPWRKAAVIAIAAAVVAGLLWTASAFSRTVATRVSPHVVQEQPGLAGRLLGSQPKLRVTVSEGSSLPVQLETSLSSETAEAGQEVLASLRGPLEVDGHEAIPGGSRVIGHVAHAAGSGKVSGRGELTIEFDRIVMPDGTEVRIETEPLQRRARSTVKKDAARIAGAAGLGAIVGKILGGGKGAAVGGAVGGSAGTGAVLATKGEEAVLGQGSALEIRLRSPFTVTIEKASK